MIVYLDNILIFTQTLENYYKIVYKILKILTKYKLYLHSKKYEFNRQRIDYITNELLTGCDT